MDWLRNQVSEARKRRGTHIFVIVLRYLLGFAFLPAGLKKVLGQPFTDPAKTGSFHEFLHTFHDTGVFYHMVGGMQLLAAVLLLTQRYAVLGAMILAPILTAILVFCWSTQVIPTAVVVTLMFGGLLLLLLWDIERFRTFFSRAGVVDLERGEGTYSIVRADPVRQIRPTHQDSGDEAVGSRAR